MMAYPINCVLHYPIIQFLMQISHAVCQRANIVRNTVLLKSFGNFCQNDLSSQSSEILIALLQIVYMEN